MKGERLFNYSHPLCYWLNLNLIIQITPHLTNHASFNQSQEVSMNNQQKNLLKKELINQILKYKLQKNI